MKPFPFWLMLFCYLNNTLHAQQIIQHYSTAANSSANSTYLNDPGLNSNPSAIIIVIPDETSRAANPHPTGVWYNGSQWAIFNQDRAAMPAGLHFSISWKNPDPNAFIVRASGGTAVINTPPLNNNPAAQVRVTQLWNPGGGSGIYNPAEISASYNEGSGQWIIRNVNGSGIPDAAAFNVQYNNRINLAGIHVPANITPVTAEQIQQLVRDANLSFENGLIKWTAAGNAFANQPVSGNTVLSDRIYPNMQYAAGGIGGDYWKSIPYPVGQQGDSWIGTYENGNGDAPTGTLTSSPFKADKRYLHFLLGGGKDYNNIYVELQVRLEDYQQAWGVGKKGLWGVTPDGFTRVNRVTPLVNGEDLYRYWFDLDAELNHQFAGKSIRICITDNSSRGWGHINADDFGTSDQLTGFIPVQKSGFTLYADKDKPVWGFADTHAHWMNHVGLNGLMHGKPGGNYATSDVRRDIPPCDEFNHGLPTLTPGMLIAQTEKAAWSRMAERLLNPGNSLCVATIVSSGIVLWPATVAAGVTTGFGAALGAIGQSTSEAQAATGALDGTITGAVWGLFTNPGLQICGYAFAKDVFAKHYGNNTPADRPEISNYIDFPRWNSFFHQMMHISWVRRSYEGGQRLMVVPVGVAKSWEFNTSADGRMGSPKQKIEEAVRELKQLVAANSSWMGIALNPDSARSIILSNKMAIVIGIEQAEIGSYFTSPADEVNWLDTLGIRHVFPVHNINNTLGAAAVFNSALNSYNDLVNRSSPDGPIVAMEVMEGSQPGERHTSVKLDRTFMRQNLRTIPIAGFGTIPFFYLNDVPGRLEYDRFTAHKNKKGLENRGRIYITELMRRGMVIDVDHMSDLTQDSVMKMFRLNQYPSISGHTNFRDLRREAATTDGPNKEAKLKTEFTIFSSRATEIINSGGMFGIMCQQNDIETAPGCTLANNSAGGTPSFIQAYWYALKKGGENTGIAFGSDFNGFAPQTAPRFGVDADFYLEKDDIRNVRCGGTRDQDKLRRCDAFSQINGVRYDVPIRTYHYHRFQQPAFLTQEERDIWEAIAISKTGVNPADAWQPGGGLSPERTGIQQDKIKNLAEGFRWAYSHPPVGDYGAFLECPGYIVRDENTNNCMPERKAAYMVVRGDSSLPAHMRTTRTMELYQVIRPIYQLWMQFENGPNEPLRRSFAYAGGRDFDYNLDGLAQYGLFPDMIQDMKNLGLTPGQLRPLFLGTDQYLKLWDKAIKAGRNIHL